MEKSYEELQQDLKYKIDENENLINENQSLISEVTNC